MPNYKVNPGSGILESILDLEGGQVRTIDTAHSKIHEEKAFVTCAYKEDLADDGIFNFLLKNTDVSELHTVFAVNFEGNALVELFEGTTVSANGTETTVFNRKRSSVVVSGATAFHTPTISGDGTLLTKVLIPGGSGPQSSGGSNESRFEWELKEDVNYLLRTTNISGNVKSGTITADFYIE